MFRGGGLASVYPVKDQSPKCQLDILVRRGFDGKKSGSNAARNSLSRDLRSVTLPARVARNERGGLRLFGGSDFCEAVAHLPVAIATTLPLGG